MNASEAQASRSSQTVVVDSLTAGLSFLLLSNVLQRGVGFLRNLGVCHFLTDDQLGMWALASSFFVLAAPLAVLGLPGSFGRFVEHYRRHGQLRSYLKRTRVGSIVGSALLAALMLSCPGFSSWIVFGQPIAFATLVLVVTALLAVIAFNYLTELMSGLRRPRVVSTMQCINSLVFTMAAIVWLAISQDWRGLVAAFAIAAMVGMIPAWRALRSNNWDDCHAPTELPWRAMWQRVVPFATAMWLMNLLSNLLDVVDRYMLLHWSGSPELGQSMVGQYHSGRILPALLASLAMMLSGMLLPYWSAEFESGRIKKLHQDIQTTFKFTALGFVGLAIAAMAVAPWLFDVMLGGKYQDGLSIMPASLAQCIWSALALLMYNYLWCREKGWLIALVMMVGLAVNLQLNYWWIPLSGLHGAMAATSIACVVTLGLTLMCLQAFGCSLRPVTIAFALLPATLLYSHLLTAVIVTVLTLLISRTRWILSDDEKRAVEQCLLTGLQRCGIRMQRLWALHG